MPQNDLPLQGAFKTPPKSVFLWTISRFMYFKIFDIMENTNKRKIIKSGRKPKLNPSIHRHVFRLNDLENEKLLSLYQESGMNNKAKFIVCRLLEREVRTVKIDVATMEYHTQLTKFYNQFRAVGVNYNQIVKILNRNFSEKKAAAYLAKLEKYTVDMAELCQKIVELTLEFEAKHVTIST